MCDLLLSQDGCVCCVCACVCVCVCVCVCMCVCVCVVMVHAFSLLFGTSAMGFQMIDQWSV